MHVPHGWIDLEPMFLESHGDVVVLDCLGDRALPGSGVRASTAGPHRRRAGGLRLAPGPGGRLGESVPRTRPCGPAWAPGGPRTPDSVDRRGGRGVAAPRSTGVTSCCCPKARSCWPSNSPLHDGQRHPRQLTADHPSDPDRVRSSWRRASVARRTSIRRTGTHRSRRRSPAGSVPPRTSGAGPGAPAVPGRPGTVQHRTPHRRSRIRDRWLPSVGPGSCRRSRTGLAQSRWVAARAWPASNASRMSSWATPLSSALAHRRRPPVPLGQFLADPTHPEVELLGLRGGRTDQARSRRCRFSSPSMVREAKVRNDAPWPGSNRSTAWRTPITAVWRRSSVATPADRAKRATK